MQQQPPVQQPQWQPAPQPQQPPQWAPLPQVAPQVQWAPPVVQQHAPVMQVAPPVAHGGSGGPQLVSAPPVVSAGYGAPMLQSGPPVARPAYGSAPATFQPMQPMQPVHSMQSMHSMAPPQPMAHQYASPPQHQQPQWQPAPQIQPHPAAFVSPPPPYAGGAGSPYASAPAAPLSSAVVGKPSGVGCRSFDDCAFLGPQRVHSVRIHAVRVWASAFVHGLQVVYVQGATLFDGPLHGSALGMTATQTLAPTEHLISVGGRVADNALEAVTFTTSSGKVSRFGAPHDAKSNGREFTIPLPVNHRIVGFHGSHSRDITSLGAFTLHV